MAKKKIGFPRRYDPNGSFTMEGLLPIGEDEQDAFSPPEFFEVHVASCWRCKQRPFDLCRQGARLKANIPGADQMM